MVPDSLWPPRTLQRPQVVKVVKVEKIFGLKQFLTV